MSTGSSGVKEAANFKKVTRKEESDDEENLSSSFIRENAVPTFFPFCHIPCSDIPLISRLTKRSEKRTIVSDALSVGRNRGRGGKEGDIAAKLKSGRRGY